MKKLTLVAVLLLAVCVAGFAADQLTFTVDGSATATFGIDLETQEYGFKNDKTATLDITLIAEQTAEKGGTEGAYGYIKLATFKLLWDEATLMTQTLPTVTAKVVSGPLWVGIYGLPAFTTVDKVVLVDGTAAATLYTTVGGISIGYDTASLDLIAKVASAGNWDAPADGWTVGLDAVITAAPLTLEVGTAMGFDYATNPVAFGVKPSLALDVSGDMDLKPYIAFDGVLPESGDMTWELGAGATFELTADDKATIALTSSYSEATDFDVKLAIHEDAGAPGFHPALGADASLLLKDLGGTMGYKVSVGANWTTAQVYPYFTVSYDDAAVLGLNVGTKLFLIPNTTFQVDYATVDMDSDLGDLELSVKIDF